MFRRRLENTFPGLHVIGSFLVRSYLLIDEGEAVLIDSGLLWEPHTVKMRLRASGLPLEHLTTILLTHGHLDHTANLSWYRKHTKARVLAHPLEQIHIDARSPTRGPIASVIGWNGLVESFSDTNPSRQMHP